MDQPDPPIQDPLAPTQPSSGGFGHWLRRAFFSGVLITVPVIVTGYVLYFLFRQIDGILSPLIHRVWGHTIPGLGLAATIILILLVGVIGRNVFGSRLVSLGERLIIRTPIARTIYGAARQFVEAVTSPEKRRFNRVVLIQYPRHGMFSLGFVSGRTDYSAQGAPGRELVSVFVPSTPTPVTGFVVMLPPEELIYLSLTPEQAIKYLVSGGLAVPVRMSGSISEIPQES
ncbi:MAG TPA: DUF502 domain-containing protein [candidate division Zixibacteria bacterium]|jgi:uncharacterized membrane protein